MDGTRAARVAEAMLIGVGTRLAHSRRVASQAVMVAPFLAAPWRDALVQAAWLHDIGYSPSISITGLHPLDGARFLRDLDWSKAICGLVAWHTRPTTEATLRGHLAALRGEFAQPPALALAALTWADLTSTPTGEACQPSDRITEILRRHKPGSMVHEATTANLPDLLADVRMIEDLIADSVHSAAL